MRASSSNTPPKKPVTNTTRGETREVRPSSSQTPQELASAQQRMGPLAELPSRTRPLRTTGANTTRASNQRAPGHGSEGIELQHMHLAKPPDGLSDRAKKAFTDLQKAERQHRAYPGDRAVEDHLANSLANWLHEASVDIRMKCAPGGAHAVDPSLRIFGANAAAQFIGSIANFTLPAVVALLAGKVGASSLTQTLITVGGTVASKTGLNDVQPWMSRQLGGADISLRLGKDGPYHRIANQLAMTVLGIAFYSAGGLAVAARNPELVNSALGRLARGAVGAGTMAIGTQATAVIGAHVTQKLNNMSARDLPETEHTRTLGNGLYAKKHIALRDRTTLPMKLLENVPSLIGAIIGALPLFFAVQSATENPAHNANDALGNTAKQILGGYGALLTMIAVAQAVAVRLAFDPARHMPNFKIPENNVLINTIRETSKSNVRMLLDQANVDLENAPANDPERQRHEAYVRVLTGESFRQGDIDDVARLKDHLYKLGEEIEQLSHPRQNRGNPIASAAIRDISRSLTNAADSATIAQTNYLEKGNGALYPEVSSIAEYLRATQSKLRQALIQLNQTQSNTEELSDFPDHRIPDIIAKVFPLLAAVRKTDRIEIADRAADILVSFNKASGGAPNGAYAKLEKILGVTGIHQEVLNTARRLDALSRSHPGQTSTITSISDAISELLAKKFKGDLEKTARAPTAVKLMLLQAALNQAHPDGPPISGNTDSHDASLLQARPLDDHLECIVKAQDNKTALRDARSNFLNNLRNGQIPLDTLRDEVLQRIADKDFQSADEENTRLADANQLQSFQKLLSNEFVETALGHLNAAKDGNISDVASDLIHNLQKDLEEHKKANLADYEARMTASSIVVELPIRGVPLHEQKDVHAHLTNYNGVITSMARQHLFNLANGVTEQLNAAIPHQLPNSSSEKKYYSVVRRLMDYMNRDYSLAQQWLQLDHETRTRVLTLAVEENAVLRHLAENPGGSIRPTTTGPDPTDANSAKREIRHLTKAFANAGVPISVMGETTLYKEGVGKLTPRLLGQIPRATDLKTLTAAMNAGLAFLLHMDLGETRRDKWSNYSRVTDAVNDLVKMTQENVSDPLLLKRGNDNVPPRKMSLIYAHALGQSVTKKEPAGVAKEIDTLLDRRDLAGDLRNEKKLFELNIDLSWDYVAHHMYENTYDLINHRGLDKSAPGITQGLQDLLKTYRSFAKLGGASDKTDDISRDDLTLGLRQDISDRREEANNVARLHLEVLAQFQKTVEREFAIPQAREAFMEMASSLGNESDKHNNWLFLLQKHRDRFLYGSDTLAPGIKAHGEMAYVINTKILSPFYVIFDELAKYDADKFAGISDAISHGNFDRIQNDPMLRDRREAYQRDVGEGEGDWGSGPPRPTAGLIEPAIRPAEASIPAAGRTA